MTYLKLNFYAVMPFIDEFARARDLQEIRIAYCHHVAIYPQLCDKNPSYGFDLILLGLLAIYRKMHDSQSNYKIALEVTDYYCHSGGSLFYPL